MDIRGRIAIHLLLIQTEAGRRSGGGRWKGGRLKKCEVCAKER